MEEFELEPGEHVVLNVRTHPFVLAMQLLPFGLFLFLPTLIGSFLTYIAHVSGGAAFVIDIPAHTDRFLSGVWYLILWVGAFSVLTRYQLTVWVITNIRIVDIRQYSFFNREVSSFLLVRVQDITTEVSGIIGTLVGFGRLSVETAGKDEDFRMEGISVPEQVRDVIMSQVAQLHSKDAVTSGL